MGRMRDEPERASTTRRMVYVVCEGFTEHRYLEDFGGNNRGSGMFEFKILDKEGFDRDLSDRDQLIQLIHGFIELRTAGKYTPFQYVTAVFHSNWDAGWMKRDAEERERLSEEIWRIRRRIIRDSAPALDSDGTYVEDFDAMDRLIRDRTEGGLNGMGDRLWFDPGLRQTSPRTSYGDLDRVFVVFDRDRVMYSADRTDGDYRKLFAECGALGYEILMSTPLFEFWLLLHHADIDATWYSPFLDHKNEVLEALKSREEAHCHDWDGGIDCVKGISRERSRRFYGNGGFFTALEQSKRLPTDLEGLLDHVGTNVGIGLESLLAGRCGPSPF